MSNIVELINQIPGVLVMEGCSDEQIQEAEEALSIKFPQEYIDYVKAFGCIEFKAKEWTGLNIKGRLNTVNATLKEKSVNDDFPAGFFVLENTCIDAIVIACNEAGEVFFVQNSVCRKIADSISGYIELSLT